MVTCRHGRCRFDNLTITTLQVALGLRNDEVVVIAKSPVVALGPSCHPDCFRDS